MHDRTVDDSCVGADDDCVDCGGSVGENIDGDSNSDCCYIVENLSDCEYLEDGCEDITRVDNSLGTTTSCGDSVCCLSLNPKDSNEFASGSVDESLTIYRIPRFHRQHRLQLINNFSHYTQQSRQHNNTAEDTLVVNSVLPSEMKNVLVVPRIFSCSENHNTNQHQGTSFPTPNESVSGGIPIAPYKVLSGIHTDTVSCVGYSFDGRYLASAGYDGKVNIFDSQLDYELVSSMDGPSGDLDWCQWHPKGYAVLAGSSDGTVWMWWAPTGSIMKVFAGHGEASLCGGFASGGKTICSGGADCALLVFNPKSAEVLHRFSRNHTENIICLDTYTTENLDHSLVATGSEDNTCRVFSIDTCPKQCATFRGFSDSVTSVKFRQTGSPLLIATGSLDGTIKIWDMSSSSLRSTMVVTKTNETANAVHSEEPVNGVTCIQWHPTKVNLLLSSYTDGSIRIWDVRNGQCECDLRGSSLPILDFSVFKLSMSDDLFNEGVGVRGQLVEDLLDPISSSNTALQSFSICRVVACGDDRCCRYWDIVHKQQ